VRIIVDQLGVDESEVTSSVSFEVDLDADSLDLIKLTMEVEAVFKVTISDEVVVQLATAKEVQGYLIGRSTL
jgi:acyl carrier protein